MTIDLHNRTLLKKTLYVPKNNNTESVSYNKIDKWYDYRYLPEITSEFGTICLFRPKHEGGGFNRLLEEYTIDGVSYLFKVDVLDAVHMRLKDREIENTDGIVYFISLLQGKDNPNFNCIHLTIFKDDRLALVNGFTKKYPCIGVRNKDKLLTYSGPKEGEILMNGLLMFLYKYRDKFEIDEIELDDSSVFPCKSIVNINLLISRQLMGLEPFYMKFGFVPREESAFKKIRYNLELMRDYIVPDNFIYIIKDITDSDMPIEVIRLINNWIGKSLSKLLSIISDYDCLYYSKFYKSLYYKLNLKELTEDETAFRLRL